MIELLGYSAIALLAIKYFSPLQPIREAIVEWGIDYTVRHRIFPLMYMWQVLSCPYCFSFWFTLGLTQDIYGASIVAIITKVVDLIIQKLDK